MSNRRKTCEWQWLNDLEFFQPFEEDVDAHLEMDFQLGKPTSEICMDPKSNQPTHMISFAKMEQTRLKPPVTIRKIKRIQLIGQPPAPSSDVIWKWEPISDLWFTLDLYTTAALEAAMVNGVKSVKNNMGKIEYEFDLHRMCHRNRTHAFVGRIERIGPPPASNPMLTGKGKPPPIPILGGNRALSPNNRALSPNNRAFSPGRLMSPPSNGTNTNFANGPRTALPIKPSPPLLPPALSSIKPTAQLLSDPATIKFQKLTSWKVIMASAVEEDEMCSICMCDLVDGSGAPIVQLSRCSGRHFYHMSCAVEMLKNKPKCCVCNVYYDTPTGTCPPGKMSHAIDLQTHIPGFPPVGCIVIRYDIPSGIQGPEHPKPGKPFTGTRRQAFLPNTPKGKQVLALLTKCFNKRLTFAIGNSLSTGQEDVIVWTTIHHKTAITGTFGYPDNDYLDRVIEELTALGIE